MKAVEMAVMREIWLLLRFKQVQHIGIPCLSSVVRTCILLANLCSIPSWRIQDLTSRMVVGQNRMYRQPSVRRR